MNLTHQKVLAKCPECDVLVEATLALVEDPPVFPVVLRVEHVSESEHRPLFSRPTTTERIAIEQR